jgi:hypothetical protein
VSAWAETCRRRGVGAWGRSFFNRARYRPSVQRSAKTYRRRQKRIGVSALADFAPQGLA